MFKFLSESQFVWSGIRLFAYLSYTYSAFIKRMARLYRPRHLLRIALHGRGACIGL